VFRFFIDHLFHRFPSLLLFLKFRRVVLSLVSRSKAESYQADAISSMIQLQKDHWDHFHTYRLEWQPGKDGYIHWYMDDKFRFGIEAAGLKEEHSQIPNEPSYIIMNTAISTSWGFPQTPPGCDIFDCKDLIKGQCGMFPGFCKTLPAEFHIDFVRVYQKKNDSSQTIGCNPKEYPTKRFIDAHAYRYKGGDQVTPLLPQISGTGHCKKDTDCGEGKCFRKRCTCNKGWTGPRCLVREIVCFLLLCSHFPFVSLDFFFLLLALFLSLYSCDLGT
jgi:hypothetical protein